MEPLIRMEGITKEFPGVKALDNISFDIMPGEVHVLIGENGAGKSTLMKILSGVYSPTKGKIVCNGREYSNLSTADSYNEGIAIVYQELSVIDELSIMENLFVGKLPTKKYGPFSVVDYKQMEQKATDVLKRVGLRHDAKTLVGELAMPDKQLCEIAKALVSGAKVIVLDEPTTSLTTSEVENLHNLIRTLKADGCGIVYISHKMSELHCIGDRITVLKDGTYVGTYPIQDLSIDQLVTLMVGREVKGTYLADSNLNVLEQPIVFEVKDISRKDGKCRNVSFQLHKGEILGFAGLVGAGRTETMEAVFGAAPMSSGEIYLNGKELKISSPYRAIKQGLGMLTENRRETGFAKNFSCKQNISLIPFIKTSTTGGIGGLLDLKAEQRWANEQTAALNVKCTSPDQPTVTLSGGNQQKVILGKWLAADSEVLIFDEPTKGIDVGSKSEIYILMRKLANEGKGILMISSEQTELLSTCDRIAVFRGGELQEILMNSEATEEKIVKISTNE
ncbi:MAG: ATP-binding cassette domain-containing protein [Lachnospiraceae bacterium]|nr:ATP-binding cassette domain-containing protein [Lachnospiraceae bacterium]